MRRLGWLVVLAACGGPAAPPAAPRVESAPAVAAPAVTAADGDAHFEAKRWAEAVAAYEAAGAAGKLPVRARMRAAIASVQAGDLDGAFAWLERALAGGMHPVVIEGVPPLAAAVADPRWAQLKAGVKPACQAPEHRALDFWAGTWEVFDQAGAKLGENVITIELGGCVLMERWRGAQGDTGQSSNFWEPARGEWVQEWIDDGGRLIHYAGNVDASGAMILVGDNVIRDGTVNRTRMTLAPQPDGTVLQRIEYATGTTFALGFEGIYRRKLD